MARPLRIELVGGWYHLTVRGNERKSIFRDDRDRGRFLELLEQWVRRYAVRLHAYVLMDNHYHLLAESLEPNLTRAMQWLGVSYTVWFNHRHNRVGHLFQGRYKAIVLEPDSAAWEVSRYVHLNPVRVKALGQGKRDRGLAAAGRSGPPDRRQVGRRLERLREYRWSSYRSYAGWAATPKWLTTSTVLRQAGGGGEGKRRQVYRRYVEEAVREGLAESPWERLEAQMLLGGAEFVRRMKGRAHGDVREQPQYKQIRARPGWEQIVAAVEREKGEKWEAFRDRHGDWGRDVALYLGREHGGMRLRELAEKAGGLDYSSVQVAVRRLTRRLVTDRRLKKTVNQMAIQLSDNET